MAESRMGRCRGDNLKRELGRGSSVDAAEVTVKLVGRLILRAWLDQALQQNAFSQIGLLRTAAFRVLGTVYKSRRHILTPR
jgi:hypothetical protein